MALDTVLTLTPHCFAISLMVMASSLFRQSIGNVPGLQFFIITTIVSFVNFSNFSAAIFG